jgi:hypothetical protein
MRLAHLLAVTSIVVGISGGCRHRDASKENVGIFKTAEEARAHVQATKISGDRFELAISNDFEFAGSPDTSGAGMAIVLDSILAQGYGPDGFEQRKGYRLYRYKPLK